MRNPWLSVWMDAARLALEAHTVVALRMMRLAHGGRASRTEARRMVQEKITAAVQAQQAGALAAMSGSAPKTSKAALGVYRKRVRRNRRRLSK